METRMFILVVSCFALSRCSTNCGMGGQCSSCTGDRKGSVTLSSGRTVDVCCRGCSSSYFVYGSVPQYTEAFCDCHFDDIDGGVWKGEECDAPGLTTYGHYQKMPLCCPDPLVLTEDGETGSRIEVSCVRNGDCWRGSLCESCNNSGSINGVDLCCPNCEEYGLIISTGGYCSCNRYTDRDA